MTCTALPGGVVVCRPAGWVEYSRTPAGVRWCFACRGHLPHDLTVEGEPPEARSYYAPTPRYDCSGCHRDRTCFPGTWREWEEE